MSGKRNLNNCFTFSPQACDLMRQINREFFYNKISIHENKEYPFYSAD